MSIPNHSFGHLRKKNDDDQEQEEEFSMQNQNQKNSNTNKKSNNSNNKRRDGVLLKNCGTSLVEEDDEGSVEYKWRLVGITEQRLEHLVTQMKFRVAEGRGECIYEIGVEDDGYTRGLPQAEFDESIATLRTMASRLGFTLTMNCVVSKQNPKDPSQVLKCAEVRIRKIVQTLPTCRIAVTGDTNSGKSTLVGVVCAGELDDGGGTVRQRVFNHKHELQSGQTSSVCDRIIGFSTEGGIVNYGSNNNNEDEQTNYKRKEKQQQQNHSTRKEQSSSSSGHGAASGDADAITERAATLTLLMDLPGHLKRSHTALSALVGRFPHVVCLVINPNDLSTSSSSSATATTTRTNISTHIAQCAALQLPFFVVFTHQDSTPALVLGQAAAQVDKAIGEETGKRLVMVSSPIFPGESGGGFSGREMVHASSDMFLSDLASTTANETPAQVNNKNGNNTMVFGSSPPQQKSATKKNNTKSNSFDPFYSSFGGDTANNNNNNNDDTASSFLKSDLGTENATPQKNTNNNKQQNTNNNKDDDHFSSASGRHGGGNTDDVTSSRNPVETYLEKNVPVFIVSSVTGYGIQFFKHFLHQLSLTPPRLTVDECEDQQIINNQQQQRRRKKTNHKKKSSLMIAATKSSENEGSTDGQNNDGTTYSFEEDHDEIDFYNEDEDDYDYDDSDYEEGFYDDDEETDSDDNKKSEFDKPSQMLMSNEEEEQNSNNQGTTKTASDDNTTNTTNFNSGECDDEEGAVQKSPKNKTTSKRRTQQQKTIRHIPTVRFVVDKIYSVARVGLVVAGTVTSGTIQVGQHLFWGPNKQGTFFPVQVASLHYQRNFVRSVGSGNECAVAFEGGDFTDSPDIQAMSTRKGTLLYGNGLKRALPPATSTNFRVLLSKAQSVTTAESDFKVDMELTAFVFSAKQSVFLKSIEPVDFSSEDYALVRAQRSVGDALRPLILQCSFVYQPEVLAVGAPIVLLRNTPDGRLGACVAGRILSFVACERTKSSHHHHHHHHHTHHHHGRSSKGNSPSSSTTNPNSGGTSFPTSASSAVATPTTSCNSTSTRNHSRSLSNSSQQQMKTANNQLHHDPTSSVAEETVEQQQQQGQFPKTEHLPVPSCTSASSSTMNKPQTSSPPLTPTTNPPSQMQQVSIAAELEVAKERAERKKLKQNSTNK